MAMPLSLQATPGTPPASLGGDDDRRLGEVMELVDQLNTTYKGRDKLWQDTLDVIFSVKDPAIPKGYAAVAKIVKSPLPLHMVNTVTASLTVNAPAVQFRPTGFGEAALVNATKREHFMDAAWRRQEEEAAAPVFRQFMWNVVALGTGVLKTVERSKRAWTGYDKEAKKIAEELDREHKDDRAKRDREYKNRTDEFVRAKPYPISTASLDPSTVKALKTLDGLSVVVEQKEVPYFDTLQRFGFALDGGGNVVPQAMGLGLPETQWSNVMSGGKTLRLVEVWTYKTVTYVLVGPNQKDSKGNRGVVVKEMKHGYGDPVLKTLRGPFFICDGTVTASHIPERSSMGILTPFLSLFPTLDTFLSIQATNAMLTGFASFKTVGGKKAALPASSFGKDNIPTASGTEPLRPGYVYDEDIEPVNMPRGGVDLDKAIDTNRGFLDMALPSVLQGVVDTTDSGYMLNQAIHIARLAFDPMVQNAERTLARQVGFHSWLIEHKVGQEVFVYGESSAGKKGSRSGGEWLSLGPDDLKGIHCNYDVRLSPETPTNRVIDIRAHAEAVQNGFESQADAIEDLGRNADEVQKATMLEKYLARPEIQDMIFRRVDELLGIAQKQQMAQADAMLPPGPPPMDPNALPPPPGQALGAIGDASMPGQNGMPLLPTQPGVAPMLPAGPGPIPIPGPGPGLAPTLPGQAGNIPGVPQNMIPFPGGPG